MHCCASLPGHLSTAVCGTPPPSFQHRPKLQCQLPLHPTSWRWSDQELVLKLTKWAVQGSVSYSVDIDRKSAFSVTTRPHDLYLKAVKRLLALSASMEFSEAAVTDLLQVATGRCSLDTFNLLSQRLQCCYGRHPELSSFEVSGEDNSRWAAYNGAVGVVNVLCPQAQRLSSGQIFSLLRTCQQPYEVEVSQYLLKLPATAMLGSEAMEQLLLQAIYGAAGSLWQDLVDERPSSRDLRLQYGYGSISNSNSSRHPQRGSSEAAFLWLDTLIKHPSAPHLIAAAVGRLFTAAATANLGERKANTYGIMRQSVALPAVYEFDADAVGAATTAVMGPDTVDVSVALLDVPGAAMLSTADIMNLLQHAVFTKDQAIYDQLLQHPHAPHKDDPEMQVLDACWS